MYLGVAAISLPAGMLIVRSQGDVSLALLALVGLAGFAVMVSLSPRVLFLGWLLFAPFLQNSADTSTVGRALTWGLYTVPAVLFIALTFMRPNRAVAVSRVDFLPGAYAAYVLASIALTTNLLTTNTSGTAKAYFVIVAMGVVLYYFLTFGPGSEVSSRAILVTLMVGAAVQGVLAIIEYATGWNVWHTEGWHEVTGGARAVSTLANPAVLGMFLGAGIVSAVAFLVWGSSDDERRRLRRLSWAVLVVCTPGLLFTLTRGPVLATAIAVVLLLLVGRARVVGLAVLAVAGVTVLLLLPSFRDTELYRDRVAERANVQFREVVRDWSLRLAAEKPVFGWGYGSFDRVKNASGFHAEGVPTKTVLTYTSHETYLTMLVELGGLGLLLFVSPFLFLGTRALVRARGPTMDWVTAATLGSLLVIFLTASTVDFRFFSFAQLLPFVLLAILRRPAAPPPEYR